MKQDFVCCQYKDIRVRDEWNEINFAKDYGPLYYMQLTNRGEWPILCSMSSSPNDWILGVGETMTFNVTDEGFKKLNFKLKEVAFADFGILEVIGCYKVKLKKYRAIDEPFEVSKNQ